MFFFFPITAMGCMSKCLHFCFPLLINFLILFLSHVICIFDVLHIICDVINLPVIIKMRCFYVETLFNVSHQRCSFNDRRNLTLLYNIQNCKICLQNLSFVDPIAVLSFFSPPLSLRYFELRMNTLNSTK